MFEDDPKKRAAAEDAFARVDDNIPLDHELQSMTYLALCKLLSSCEKGSAKLLIVEAEKRRRDSSPADHVKPIGAVQKLAGHESSHHPNEWHEKPLGKVWLMLVGGLLVLLVAYILRNHLGIL